MLKTLVESAVGGVLEKGAGGEPAGPVTAALITTGASLLLTRGRRSVGVAFLAAGGFLLWRQSVKERAAVTPAPSPVPSPALRASAATAPH